MSKLSVRELDLLVNYWIGCNYMGHLGDGWTPEYLRAFFQVWCDLDINPISVHVSQVRDEFVDIMNSQTSQVQAKILRTLLASLPMEDSRAPATRNGMLHAKLSDVANRLEESNPLVENILPKRASDVVRLALTDAEHLVGRGSAVSSVDRTHTALHGYLKDVCDEASVQYRQNASITELFKLVRSNHPCFHSVGARQSDTDRICKTLASIVDTLNTIRNQATPAHPQDELLGEAEAVLAINSARSVFHYLEDKRSPRGRDLMQRLFSRR